MLGSWPPVRVCLRMNERVVLSFLLGYQKLLATFEREDLTQTECLLRHVLDEDYLLGGCHNPFQYAMIEQQIDKLVLWMVSAVCYSD